MLLVASEAMSAAGLSPIVGGDTADTAVLVVAAALQRTRLEYWAADSDEPIERARRIQQATTGALRRAHVPSSGHVGSRDFIAAIDDALRFFDADEIVLALHTHGRRRYGERHLRAEVEQRPHRGRGARPGLPPCRPSPPVGEVLKRHRKDVMKIVG